MKNREQKIFVFDVGNTLIEKPNNHMNFELIQDLFTLQKQGNLIGLATMRNLTMLEKLISQLRFDFIIALNGAYVICKNNILIDSPIDDFELIQFLNILKSKEIQYELYKKYNITNSIEEEGCVYGIKIKNCSDHIDFLRENFHSFIFYSWEDGKICDVHSTNTSKSKAMELVCNYYNISLQNSIVFGDGFNDIDLFKLCNISVAMETAPDELKQVASFVTKSVSNNGVSWALKHLQL
ncbi:HAD family hydrolase [Capnocytophaga stomatis]|uniref:HAD family hydrolase n=1 Tax=Capnocytophaga stomatis TaxID=1848904 RepID=A0A250FZA3_9FLAO|nr:HAD-IIB family hydrolase [Capnocytophaga stomatis]ATA90462.1 hypothetical protein CGC58_12390 [Capnocytophaga stomatis]GIJ97639.1 hydrolase [Capnocytophaga stomatis]GIM49470.1 hydrolase [Capnocytophaga stomatis]